MLLTWCLFSLCVRIIISSTCTLDAVPSNAPNPPQAYLLYFVCHTYGPLLCINLLFIEFWKLNYHFLEQQSQHLLIFLFNALQDRMMETVQLIGNIF